MFADRWKSSRPWLLALLSSLLLELPYPLAGPLPAWRSLFAWFALAPLLLALLSEAASACPRPLRRGFLIGYLFGTLWFMGNCYWVRDTMAHYGEMPPLAPTGILILFSLYLGLYGGLFGLMLALVHRATGCKLKTLATAPFLWVAMELACARITGFPWDQLGMSQIDNPWLTLLAPWTGVYGISFLIAAANALLALALASEGKRRLRLGCSFAILLAGAGIAGLLQRTPHPAPSREALLVQPNLDVAGDGSWQGPGAWQRHIDGFAHAASLACTPFHAGLPLAGAPFVTAPCNGKPPALVAWPESPAPFLEHHPAFRMGMQQVAQSAHAPLIIGGNGVKIDPAGQADQYYNSAIVFNPQGEELGRYDKIHLVPFGEYIPFSHLLSFARALTAQVGEMARGTERATFSLDGHSYGIFICYESVFADEVRLFAKNGAEVFVNISDDGWYGDSSAPWQHLNMARMRAIENRRWILRDTNNGVTAVIDPWGNLRQSIDRHQESALRAGFAFNRQLTFYTLHGDLFALGCAILTIGLLGWSLTRPPRPELQDKDRS